MITDQIKTEAVELMDIARDMGMSSATLYGISLAVETAFQIISHPDPKAMLSVMRKSVLNWRKADDYYGAKHTMRQISAGMNKMTAQQYDPMGYAFGMQSN